MKKSITFLSIVGSLCFTNLAQAEAIPIVSEGDYGSHNRYPASNATDKNTAFASRWASNIDL